MIRRPRSYREALILAVARARRRVRDSEKAEADYWRRAGKSPDDQIIYETYESAAALRAFEYALALHRSMAAPTTRISRARVRAPE